MDETGLRILLKDHDLRAILVFSTAVWFAFGIVLPTISLFASSFGVGYQLVGVLVGAYAVGRLICDLPSGALLERIEPGHAASLSAFAIGAFAILTGWSPVFWFAVVCQLFIGCAFALLISSLFNCTYGTMSGRSEGRRLGLFFSTFSFGAFVGEAAGGAISHEIGLHGVMYLWGAISILIAPFAWGGLPRSTRSEHRPHAAATVERWTMVTKQHRFRMAASANFGLFWVSSAVTFVVIPLYLENVLKSSVVAVGFVVSVATASELVALYPAGVITDRFGPRYLLIISLVVLAVATSAIALCGGIVPTAVVLGIAGVMTGTSVVASAALLSSHGPEQAMATAAFRFCGDLGYVIGPVVAGLAIDGLGFRWAFVIAAGPPLLANLFAIWPREDHQSQPA